MRTKKGLLSLLVVTLLALSLLAACPSRTTEEASPLSQTLSEEGIEYGGRLVVGFMAPKETMQLTDVGYTSWSCLTTQLLYDPLAHYPLPPDYYEFHPRLVQSYEVSEDGLTWTLHIIENAKWHDGEPVTSEDIKFTCEYLFTCPGWEPEEKANFDRIEIIDDSTLNFVFTKPTEGWYVPGWWLWNPVIPKHIFEPYKDDVTQYPNEEGIGCGPFKLREFKSGEYSWFVANDDYWGGRPYLDEVVFKYYGSLDTMLMALRSGEIDVCDSALVPPTNMEDLETALNVEIEVGPGNHRYSLSCNLHKEGPLQDKNVRHAIQYGIDRDRIIEMVYLGYAEKFDSWSWEGSPDHSPNLPQYEYNPDKANEILDEAGYVDTDGNGIRNDQATAQDLVFELVAPAEEINLTKTCTLIAEMLLDIGVSIDFQTVDYDTFYATVYSPADDAYEIAITDTGGGPPPIGDWIWIEAMGWGSGGDWWNPSYYDNPRYNELASLLSEAPDMATRLEHVYEMQEIMSEDLPYIYLVKPKCISPYRTDKFEGWTNSAGGMVSDMNPWSILNLHLKAQ
ncbi:MAG: ABC transporter substrate-binding protein [Deltaproteobacteria bacterium]|nr:ABC transporter substrate-binding protein [Deltaproteobacteria bacterium]